MCSWSKLMVLNVVDAFLLPIRAVLAAIFATVTSLEVVLSSKDHETSFVVVVVFGTEGTRLFAFFFV
ncbi:hypothetical protein BFP72_14205 [Reichenbachiella sp. 5M10]|nr:hypothetical protein BFP72_14205 [Reichenbachiella sp. 5M10]